MDIGTETIFRYITQNGLNQDEALSGLNFAALIKQISSKEAHKVAINTLKDKQGIDTIKTKSNPESNAEHAYMMVIENNLSEAEIDLLKATLQFDDTDIKRAIKTFKEFYGSKRINKMLKHLLILKLINGDIITKHFDSRVHVDGINRFGEMILKLHNRKEE